MKRAPLSKRPSEDLSRLLLLRTEALVEALVGLRHFTQKRRRLEAIAVLLGETVGFFDERLRAPEQVNVADGAAAIGRKAPSEDRAHIRVARIGDDAFLEAARHFDALAEEKALGELRLQLRRTILHLHFDTLAQTRPNPRRFAVVAIFVITLAAFAAD